MRGVDIDTSVPYVARRATVLYRAGRKRRPGQWLRRKNSRIRPNHHIFGIVAIEPKRNKIVYNGITIKPLVCNS